MDKNYRPVETAEKTIEVYLPYFIVRKMPIKNTLISKAFPSESMSGNLYKRKIIHKTFFF